MQVEIEIARPEQAAQVAELRNKVANNFTETFGRGQWSWLTSEVTVKQCMRGNSRVLVAKKENEIIGTVCLQMRKPWAINTAYFTSVPTPLYLVDLAVHPGFQRQGIGSLLMEESRRFASEWHAQAIRLDAYDGQAGAAGFYIKCGYTEIGHAVYKGTALIYFELLL
jgi:GNAT superfamily N-acetyltransferase